MASVTRAEAWPDRAIHPGIYLGEELETRGMTQAELARRMERPVQVVNEVVRGRKAISEETALGLERVLGTPSRVWLNLQSMYALARVRIEEEPELEAQAGWLDRFPVREMAKRGWIDRGETTAGRVRELLRFLGIQSFSRWDERQTALGLRLSPKARTDPMALHAWVRRGEVEGHAVPTEPYDETRFRGALERIRGLTARRGFWEPMREECASAGVALVAVRELPKTGAQGVARWLTPEKALIQLNIRYRWADIFWFTFFHEACHVLGHPRREVFVDARGTARDEREAEADRFAADFLIPQERWEPFAASKPHTAARVREFAAAEGIVPGIVAGRLQHERLIPHDRLNWLRARLAYTGGEGE